MVYAPKEEVTKPSIEPEIPENPIPEVENPPTKEPIPEIIEEVIENPQTGDKIYYDVILLVVSILCTLFVYRKKIFLVLSNRFKLLKKFSNMFL